jgi:hypothetical protein
MVLNSNSVKGTNRRKCDDSSSFVLNDERTLSEQLRSL